MLTNTTEDIYLGRQPILDRNKRLYGFELLFRSGSANRAVVVDDRAATSAVIVRTLSEFGIETVVERFPAFINCNAAILMGDAVHLLPPERTVLEILETTAADEAILRRCRELREHGYRLALDDFQGTNEMNAAFLALADIIKVDVLGMTPVQLKNVTGQAAAAKAMLLAEKVESEQEFRLCLDLGYQLFQGYYFSKPQVMAGRRLSNTQAALIQLLGLVQQDAELDEMEQAFKQHPMLGIKLLRLANSAGSGSRKPLSSIANAIVVLGRRQLQRWLLLMLADDSAGSGGQPLLLHAAAARGKFMELMAQHDGPGAAMADSAFVAGVVSAMDAVLGMPMEQLVASLGLTQEVRLGLLAREGPLGELLDLAQALEDENDAAVASFIASHPDSGVEMLNHAQGEALAWANRILLA